MPAESSLLSYADTTLEGQSGEFHLPVLAIGKGQPIDTYGDGCYTFHTGDCSLRAENNL